MMAFFNCVDLCLMIEVNTTSLNTAVSIFMTENCYHINSSEIIIVWACAIWFGGGRDANVIKQLMEKMLQGILRFLPLTGRVLCCTH